MQDIRLPLGLPRHLRWPAVERRRCDLVAVHRLLLFGEEFVGERVTLPTTRNHDADSQSASARSTTAVAVQSSTLLHAC